MQRFLPLQMKAQFSLGLMPFDSVEFDLLDLSPLALDASVYLLLDFLLGRLKRQTFRRFGPLGRTLSGIPYPAGPTV